jgi:hypothetical protein
MNLKAKLYILKNPTLFLLGPSSFELWFESYLDITVEPLCFCEIAFQSPFVYISPSVSLRAPLPPLWPAMCATPAASAPSCTGPRALPCLAAAFPDPALASSHRATPPVVCPSRLAPPLAIATTRSVPPPAPCRSHVPLSGWPLP